MNITGTNGVDRLVGGATAERIAGLGASDTIFAGGGSDVVVGGNGADEIWSLGLRNPWRASFDRATGDFYIGDVGQDAREEIDVLLAGSAGGANFGWKVKEGDLVYDSSVPGNPAPDSPALTDPVVTCAHDASGGFAVIGGFVYRGASGGMQGRYLYADDVSGQLWSFRLVDGTAVDVTNSLDGGDGNDRLYGGAGGATTCAAGSEATRSGAGPAPMRCAASRGTT
ncbi:MAG: PQQ-dependent sugar dehydrogenase [Amaricoccus sp.]|uniref:PQQ-dependent sugar dehydrogenase n=1 Tax=Amaricoccus sp. TaxID=1872485 RepID=UPI0039E5AED3